MNSTLRLLLLLLLGAPLAVGQELTMEKREKLQDAFPLAKGTYWVYQGPVRWTPAGSAEEREQVLTWKMEVLDTVKRDDIAAAILKGHPMNLAFYEEGREPRPYLIVRLETGKFYQVEGDRVQEVLGRLNDAADSLADLVRDSELFLDLPLTVGKTFGEAEMLKRSDLFYQWVVEEEQQVSLEEVKGIALSGPQTEYTLTFRTVGSHQFVHFVPGLGITRYVYGHHGTLSEFDLKLIEYHAGE